MSVTVGELLSLPVLNGAVILAGSEGLKKIVTAVSVLEQPFPASDEVENWEQSKFRGSEIVLTSAELIKGSVNAQCNMLRRLSDEGGAGLLFYYTDDSQIQFAERMLQCAAALCLPLIGVKRERKECRYAEAISEIMEKIIKEQMTSTYFVSEMIERFSLLPKAQRSMDTLLQMLSIRAKLSLFLINQTFQLLNCSSCCPEEVSWVKQMYKKNYREILGKIDRKSRMFRVEQREYWVNYTTIKSESASNIYVIIAKEGSAVTEDVTKQVNKVIQLFINIWNKNHGIIGVSELVRAVLYDEPVKMRSLAQILNIEVQAVESMWIVRPDKEYRGKQLRDFNECAMPKMKEFFSSYYGVSIVDLYDEHLIILVGKPILKEHALMLPEQLLKELIELGLEAVIIFAMHLFTPRDVRKAFLIVRDQLEDVRTVFPKKKVLTLSEMEFVKRCKNVLEKGEESVNRLLSVLEPLDKEDKQDLYSTLEVYLLDADMSIAETAEHMYLHKNTVKYRINRLNESFGYKINKMPEVYRLYKAAALKRILEQRI